MELSFERVIRSPWFAVVVILGAAFLFYSNTYENAFVFDDFHSITENRAVHDLGNFARPSVLFSPRGLVDATFALNYRFGGLDVRGYHLVNIVIHGLNGLLAYFLFLLVLRLALPGRSGQAGGEMQGGHGVDFCRAAALVSALIFVSHPVQTQAVTYIVQRYASMAALFYGAAVFFYLKARTLSREISSKREEAARERAGEGGRKAARRKKDLPGSRPLAGRGGAPRDGSQTMSVPNTPGVAGIALFYGLFVLCGFLAFLSKQNAASLPIAILMVEFLFLDGDWEAWKKKVPWFFLYLVLWSLVILAVLGVFSREGTGVPWLEDVADISRETASVSRLQYLFTQFNVLCIYLRLFLLPVNQNLDYMYPFKESFFSGLTPLAFLFLAGLAVFAWWARKRWSVLSFGIFWFFITLSIESSLFPIQDALFEHRLYLPLYGLSLAAGFLVFHLLRSRVSLAFVLSAFLILTLGGATYLRNQVWRDEMTLWADVVQKSPHNDRAWNNLGIALEGEGRTEEGMKCLERALEINPRYPEAHYNMALYHGRKNDLENAIASYRRAIELYPPMAKAHFNLGNALRDRGSTGEAIRHYEEAVRHEPFFSEAYYNMGNVLKDAGRLDEALTLYRKALSVDPGNVKARMNLAIALAGTGQLDASVNLFREILARDPENEKALFNLARVLEAKGESANLPDTYLSLLKRNPDRLDLRKKAAVSLFKAGRFGEARTLFLEVLEIEPADLSARLGLASALAGEGRYEEAHGQYREIFRDHPEPNPLLYYNLACLYALEGDSAASLDWLKKAVHAGYRNLENLEGDPDLEGVRNTEEFRKILKDLDGASGHAPVSEGKGRSGDDRR